MAAPAVADSAEDWLKEIKPDVSIRYRVAVIDEAGFDRTAVASTLQTLVGVKTGEAFGISGYVQFRNVTNVFTDRFNDTINGRTDFPVEADPEATELDQAYVAYSGIKNVTISAGRKKLAWGNNRFISDLVWRQNQRSFDGVFVDATPFKGVKLRYAYAYNVNRAFTDDSPVGNFDGNFHLANLEFDLGGLGDLTTYTYVLDQNDAFAANLSTITYGANLTGKQELKGGLTFGYVIEAAQQKDHTANPNDVSNAYYRFEPSFSYSGFKVRGGLEVLEGDGTVGFSTPLALLHAFNGWADRFVNTPANGLEDIYGEVSYTVPKGSALAGMRLVAAYHDFGAENIGQSYGTEWDASVSMKLFGRVNALAKIAVYDATNFSTDVTKFWFQLATNF